MDAPRYAKPTRMTQSRVKDPASLARLIKDQASSRGGWRYTPQRQRERPSPVGLMWRSRRASIQPRRIFSGRLKASIDWLSLAKVAPPARLFTSTTYAPTRTQTNPRTPPLADDDERRLLMRDVQRRSRDTPTCNRRRINYNSSQSPQVGTRRERLRDHVLLVLRTQSCSHGGDYGNLERLSSPRTTTGNSNAGRGGSGTRSSQLTALRAAIPPGRRLYVHRD